MKHILACQICQQFSKPNPLAAPGYTVNPTDVFSHWSIDFVGPFPDVFSHWSIDFVRPFPEDMATGNKFVILAVDWLTRWSEGAATKDASPEAAADFIYTHIVTRFGCPLSLQSDNEVHFVNSIIRALCRILKINHHLSTPYYPQSNEKIERVVGTIKTMLKRTVLEAATKAYKKEDGEDNVFGIGLAIDEEVIEKIREGEKERRRI